MSLQKLGKTKGKSVRRQRHMKKILAVLVALAMLSTFAMAGDEWDYIKKVYVDPNKFASLPAGYEIVDGQYSFLKMVSDDTSGHPTGVGDFSTYWAPGTLNEKAYSRLEFGGDGATASTVNAYVVNNLATSVTGKVMSDVTKQLIYQNGEAYYGMKPVTYDPQLPVSDPKFDSWAGYSRSQGAVLSGDIRDCKTPGFTVDFLASPTGENALVGIALNPAFNPTVHEWQTPVRGNDMQVTVFGDDTNANFALGEAFAGMEASAEARHYPQQTLSGIENTKMDFEASFFGGGYADMPANTKVGVDFSLLDSKIEWKWD